MELLLKLPFDSPKLSFFQPSENLLRSLISEHGNDLVGNESKGGFVLMQFPRIVYILDVRIEYCTENATI